MMKKVIFLLLVCASPYSIISGQRTLTTNENWTGTHIENDNVIVPSGITLTISAGTTVRFASGKSLKITGTGILQAGNNDASGASILFTADDGISWGHIYCENIKTSWIKNCEIEKGNTSGLSVDYGSIYGGALHVKTSSLTIEKCLIHDNSSSWGGGIFIGAGVSINLKNSKIYSNLATEGGGGIYLWQNSFSIVANCLIYNNTCTGSTYGGGGVMLGYKTGSTKLVNCTIVGNSATNLGNGVYFLNSPNSRIINSIIWGNGSGTQIYFDANTPTSVMQYSGVQGGSYATCLNLNSTNNDPAGPNFNNPGIYDYSIIYSSVLRNAGTITDAPTTDFLYKPRISTVDIGAYEVQYSIWTGASSNLWSTATNWEQSVTPSSGTGDVIIPSGLTNYPTGSTTQNFTIGSGKQMIVYPAAKVTLGTLTNNGTLLLKSDATGIASLILDSYSGNNAGTELFLTGGAINDGFRWHLISSPFASLDIAPIWAVTMNLAQWIEGYNRASLAEGWMAADGWDYSAQAFSSPLVTFSNLAPGKGYTHYYASNQTYTLQGSLNTEDVNASIVCTNTGLPLLYGHNLLGNPFSSGLDWDAIADDPSFPANTSKALHYRKDGTHVYYISGVGSEPGVNGIIPPMQGFFVKTYAASGSINLPASARVHDNIPARYKGESKSVIPMIRLKVNTGVKYDYTVVRFDESAKSGMDYDFDAPKDYLSTTGPSIYTLSEESKFSINGLPFPDPSIEIPVVVKLLTSGEHSIGNFELTGLDNYNVFLVDNSTGNITNLRTNPVVTFSSSSGLITDRFILKIAELSTGVEEPEPLVKTGTFNIYSGFGKINIQTLADDWDGKNGMIMIYDIAGKTVNTINNAEFRKNYNTNIEAPLKKGLYLIEIRSGLKKFVGKVVVR